MLPGFVVLIVKRRLSRPRRNNVKSRFLRVVGGHLTNVRVRIAVGKTLGSEVRNRGALILLLLALFIKKSQ